MTQKIVPSIITTEEENDLFGAHIVHFDITAFAKTFEQETRKGLTFKIPLMIADLAPQKFGIALISTNGGEITYISLFRRMQGETSIGAKFSFTGTTRIEEVIISELSEATKMDLSTRIAKSSAQPGSRFNYSEWKDIRDAMAQLRPASAMAIYALDTKCAELQNANYQDKLDIMLMERDALGIALDLSNFDRPEILSRFIPFRAEKAIPAFSFLEGVNIIEDDLIIRDMKTFPDWFKIDILDTPRNIVQFEKGNSVLTVINANRNKIEHTMGVDFIYFHEPFNAFVMIQYKKMEREGKNRNSLRYRFKGLSYEIELANMKRLKGHPLLNGATKTPDDYRLFNGAYYFKLCDPSDVAINPRDLVPGAYFPLDYWEFLINEGYAKGSDNGKVIEPAGLRYINNTLFIQLIQGGWIGSISPGINVISELVEESLMQKNSLIIAAKKSKSSHKT